MNAGHNAPIIFADGVIKHLEATGLPLGLFPDAEYDARITPFNLGDSLLLFTDGLTDSISSENAEVRLHAILERGTNMKQTMLNLRSLIEPKLNRDDVTILLLSRLPLPLRQELRGIGAGF